MIIENAFEQAKKNWIKQIETFSYDDLINGSDSLYVLTKMVDEAATFKRVSEINHYFIETGEAPILEPIEPTQPIEPIDEVKQAEDPKYDDDAFVFQRMVRGGQLLNINKESAYVHQIYVPENVVREQDLISGDIVSADVKERPYGNGYLTSIKSILDRFHPRKESMARIQYSRLLVEEDPKTGSLYASRYVLGGFVKNENEDILRFDILPAEAKRYQIEQGGIVDIAIDKATNYHCVAYSHGTSKESTPQPKKKVKRESETESSIFDGIDYDLAKLRDQSFVLFSNPKLQARYEGIFEKQLGMELYFYSEDKHLSDMKTAIENIPDYAIACPCTTSHLATETLREVSNEANVLHTLAPGDGPKQVLISLVELAERRDAYALISEF